RLSIIVHPEVFRVIRINRVKMADDLILKLWSKFLKNQNIRIQILYLLKVLFQVVLQGRQIEMRYRETGIFVDQNLGSRQGYIGGIFQMKTEQRATRQTHQCQSLGSEHQKSNTQDKPYDQDQGGLIGQLPQYPVIGLKNTYQCDHNDQYGHRYMQPAKLEPFF